MSSIKDVVVKFCEGEDLHTWRYISGTSWCPLWQVSREEGHSYHSTEKKRKGLMVCIPSVIKTNWRSIYLWAISKFGLSIYIFFDGVAIWFGNESGRYICTLWFMTSQQWKHRRNFFFFECINYLCVFLERAQMQRWGCVPTVRKWLRAFYFVWLALVWGMTMAFRTSCFRNNSYWFTNYLEVWVWWQHLT